MKCSEEASSRESKTHSPAFLKMASKAVARLMEAKKKAKVKK